MSGGEMVKMEGDRLKPALPSAAGEEPFLRRGRDEWFRRNGVVWRRGPCLQCRKATVEHPALSHDGVCAGCHDRSRAAVREVWAFLNRQSWR